MNFLNWSPFPDSNRNFPNKRDRQAINALPYFAIRRFGASANSMSFRELAPAGIILSLHGLASFTVALPFKLKGEIQYINQNVYVLFF